MNLFIFFRLTLLVYNLFIYLFVFIFFPFKTSARLELLLCGVFIVRRGVGVLRVSSDTVKLRRLMIAVTHSLVVPFEAEV